MSAPADLSRRYGPWAVVTGASDGIGRAFAAQLAAAGIHLVLVARRASVLGDVARELQARHGIEAQPCALDLAQPDSAAALAHATRELDVGLLVAAAGYGHNGALLDSDDGEALRMVDVNCRAVLAQSLAFGRRFAARGRGGIVLMGSLVGFQGVPGSANYAATKAYVQSLAEGLHVELAPKGVDVLSVAPGPVHSGFAARASMRMGAADVPDTVAAGALRALGRRATARPGRMSKLLGYSLATLPRGVRVRVLAQIMRGMTLQPAPVRS